MSTIDCFPYFNSSDGEETRGAYYVAVEAIRVLQTYGSR